jgi:hypothetical protein
MSERPPLQRPVMPDSVRKLAEGAPGGKGIFASESVPSEVPDVGEVVSETSGLEVLRVNKPKKEGTNPLNLRIPISLHEDLKDLVYLSGESMTEVIVNLIRLEVKRRKERMKKTL